MTGSSKPHFEYHQRSKHRVNHYAPGPGGLDWANQPNPFREFQGAVQIKLRLLADSLRTRYNDVRCGVLPVSTHLRRRQSGNSVRAFARPLRVEILWRHALGAALQPFERKSTSDRGLSPVPANPRLDRRCLPLPEPRSCARAARCSRRSAMERSILGQRDSDWHQFDPLA